MVSTEPTHPRTPGTSPAEQSPSPSLRHEFLRGVKLGFPIFLGYVPVGMAFGVLAKVEGGFAVWQAALCSLTAFAGAGQFIGLNILVDSGVVAALIATSVVNMRYVLFSTTLAPHVKKVRQPALSWLAFSLTDETFAVNVADTRAGMSTTASKAGVGLIALCGWVLGTVVGAIGAGWIGDPTTWGVDFAMPAMFAALFVALAEDRRHVFIGLIAGGMALLLPVAPIIGQYLNGSWSIVIASMAAATIASVVYR